MSTAETAARELEDIDHFAVVGPDTLLAVMNGCGTVHEGEHFWFVLERER